MSKANCAVLTPPIITTAGLASSAAIDVSSAPGGFQLQTEAIAGGGQYVVEGSLDGGATYVNLASSMFDMGNSYAPSLAQIGSNSVFDFPHQFLGLVRVRCTTAGTGTPKAFLAWNDSRQV